MKSIDLISLHNKFVTTTHCASTREKLFGKFVLSDRINKTNPFSSTGDNPIVNQARHAMAKQEPLSLQETSTLKCTAV